MTLAITNKTTVSTTPVSLLVGVLYFDAVFLITFVKTFNARFGFVRTVTSLAFIVLSSNILHHGFAILLAMLTATEATTIPPIISTNQCIPRYSMQNAVSKT